MVTAPLLLPASASLLFAIFQIIALISSNARAQSAPQTLAEDEVVRVVTNLATLRVVVTDNRSRRVSGLAQTDFELYAQGRSIPIDYFSPSTRRVALIYVLDASGSSRDTIMQQRETALALFSRFGRGSQVAVIHFRETPEIALNFSADAAKAREAFRVAALSNHRTALFNAALAAAQAFDALPPDKTERRIAVLLTDGLDTASSSAFSEVITAARARDVSFFVIHLPIFVPSDGRLVPRRPSRGVRELAERTGGRFFTVGDAKTALDPRAELDLAPVFRAIADELESQYVIGYYAGSGVGQIQTGSVEVRLAPSKAGRLRVSVLPGFK